MSAPELPGIFGNYVLGEDFVEVTAPDAISWLPHTVGWKWLALIVGILLLRLCWRRLRHWYHNRYRREALTRLATLAQQAPHEQWLSDLNRLLKLTALAGYSRAHVARLAGDEWVEFLNGECAEAPFNGISGRLLASGAYTLQLPPESERQQLLAASRLWMTTHRGRGDV